MIAANSHCVPETGCRDTADRSTVAATAIKALLVIGLLVAVDDDAILSAQETIPTPRLSPPRVRDLSGAEELPTPPAVPEEGPPLSLMQPPAAAPPMCDRVQQLIDDIAAERERLVRERELALQAKPALDHEFPQAPVSTIPSRVTGIEERLADWEKAHAERLNQLRRRIEQLNRPPPQPTEPQVAKSVPVVEETAVPPAQVPADPPTNDAGLPQDPEPIPFATDGSPVPVTRAPVDRLALANNLFGAERYRLALEIYQSVAAEGNEGANRNWVLYQIACCHRQAGNSAEAEKNYRIVAATDDAPFLAEKARWWLDIMDKRREAHESLQRLQTALDALGSGEQS